LRWRSPREASLAVCALVSVTSFIAAAAAFTTALATDALECASAGLVGAATLGDFADAAADWDFGPVTLGVFCKLEAIAAVDIKFSWPHFAGQSPGYPGYRLAHFKHEVL
jgi:hypothetical protein